MLAERQGSMASERAIWNNCYSDGSTLIACSRTDNKKAVIRPEKMQPHIWPSWKQRPTPSWWK